MTGVGGLVGLSGLSVASGSLQDLDAQSNPTDKYIISNNIVIANNTSRPGKVNIRILQPSKSTPIHTNNYKVGVLGEAGKSNTRQGNLVIQSTPGLYQISAKFKGLEDSDSLIIGDDGILTHQKVHIRIEEGDIQTHTVVA